MRQISKVVLLIAPVLIAASGCASNPAWISQKTQSQPEEQVASNRTERLLNVARKYEESGKSEVAYQLYRHIANQDPQCTLATSKMAELAPEKKSSATQFASKSTQYKSRNTLASTSPRGQHQVLEVDWEKAKLQAREKSLIADIDQKKVSDINLGYSQSPAPKRESINNSSISQTNSQLEEKQFAQPVSHLEESAQDNMVAKTDQPVMSQEWWDQEFRPERKEKTEPAVDHEVVKNDVIAQPIYEEVSTEGELVASHKGEYLKEVCPISDLCEQGASEELIQVVALLECPEPEVRIAGLIELGIKGAEAVSTSPAVRALLKDEDAMVRAHAAGTVRDIEGVNADSVKHLTSLLNEEDHGVVRLSCYLLGQMGAEARPAVPQLKTIRDSGISLTSLHAAEALTRIVPSETRSYGVMKNALFCDDAECRVFAAVSLGGVYQEAGQIAALALVDALDSHDPDVRASAALSLGGLGDHADIAIERLQDISDNDQPEVRDAALTALACLGE